jgi:hypothetical protein
MLQLSVEDSLLLLTCRAYLRPEDDEAIRRLVRLPVRWAYVLWRAEHNRTVPFLEYHLRRLSLLEHLPVESASYIKLWTSLARIRTLAQYRAVADILDAFEQAGIACFAMKGVDLNLLYYPHSVFRPMQDVDLMIHPRDAEPARKLMLDLGFRTGIFNPATGEWKNIERVGTPESLAETYELPVMVRLAKMKSPFPAALVPPALRYRHVKCYIDSSGNATFPIFADLHVNVSAGIDEEDVWNGVRLANALGRVFRVQSVTGALWFLAARIYHEAFLYNTLRLIMFGDIHTLLHKCAADINWPEVVAIAYKYEMRPALYYVLAQMGRLTGASVPAEVLALLRPDRMEIPLQHDWGDVIPKLFSATHLVDVEMAS